VCEKTVSAAVAEVVKIISDCKHEVTEAVSGMRGDMTLHVSDMCRAARHDDEVSGNLSCQDVLVRIESEQANAKADLGLQFAALHSKIEQAVLSIRPRHITEADNNNITNRQRVVNDKGGTIVVPSDNAARPTPADRFVRCASDLQIRLSEDDTVATYSGRFGPCQIVPGHQMVTEKSFQWQVKIEQSKSLANFSQINVGVMDVCAGCGGCVRRVLAAGDVVAIALDMDRLQLSFKKNGYDLGVSVSVPPGSYRLAVEMSPGHAVRIL